MAESEAVRLIREALALCPDNGPLLLHLAATLVGEGAFAAAEAEYKRALRLAPENDDAKLGLVTAYLGQGQTEIALVILEDLLARHAPPARAYLLHARLLVRTDQLDEARAAYQNALRLDPKLADRDLAERLGLKPGASAATVKDGRIATPAGPTPDDAEFDAADLCQRPEIDFSAVGGMEALKEEIRMKIIHPLRHQELFAAYGKKVGGGILLYGPPGCGKTHLARATAGEVKAGFLAVGLNDVLDMWLGQSEHKLHAIFDQARHHPPCVLFFDEVDALGASRSDMRHSAGRHLINQFLAELDGVNASNEGVLILAATNAPWHLDSAFRRPGRFDRIIFVPPPDAEARTGILQLLLAGKPQEDLDLAQLGRKTEDFSGADLKAVVDVAIEDKLAGAMRTGTPEPLRTGDLLKVAKRLHPSTREWFVTARNYALYANEGGLYDDILAYLKLK